MAQLGGRMVIKSQVRGGLGMRTILIAHHDQPFAEQLTAELRAGGYRVIDCAGPWPPELRCIRCDRGYCPLTESADLIDRKSTRLNSSHVSISYAVFCLKKKR